MISSRFRYTSVASFVLTTCAVITLISACASGYSTFYRPADGLNVAEVSARRVSLPPAIPLLENCAGICR